MANAERFHQTLKMLINEKITIMGEKVILVPYRYDGFDSTLIYLTKFLTGKSTLK